MTFCNVCLKINPPEGHTCTANSAALLWLEERESYENQIHQINGDRDLLRAKLQAAEERLGDALSLLILKDSMLDGRDRHALKRENEIVSLSTQVITLTNRADAAEAQMRHNDMADTKCRELLCEDRDEAEKQRDRLQAEVARLRGELNCIAIYRPEVRTYSLELMLRELQHIARKALEVGK